MNVVIRDKGESCEEKNNNNKTNRYIIGGKMELKPEVALRRGHGTICSILDGSEETLRSFSIALFEEG